MPKKFTEKAKEIMFEAKNKVFVSKRDGATVVKLILGKGAKKTSWGTYSPEASYEVVIPEVGMGKVQLSSVNLKNAAKEKVGDAVKAVLKTGRRVSHANTVFVVRKALESLNLGVLAEAKDTTPEGVPFSREEKVIIRAVAKRLAKADDPETAPYLAVDFTSGPGWATILVPFKKGGANIVKVKGGYEVRTIGRGLKLLGKFGNRARDLDAAIEAAFKAK